MIRIFSKKKSKNDDVLRKQTAEQCKQKQENNPGVFTNLKKKKFGFFEKESKNCAEL